MRRLIVGVCLVGALVAANTVPAFATVTDASCYPFSGTITYSPGLTATPGPVDLTIVAETDSSSGTCPGLPATPGKITGTLHSDSMSCDNLGTQLHGHDAAGKLIFAWPDATKSKARMRVGGRSNPEHTHFIAFLGKVKKGLFDGDRVNASTRQTARTGDCSAANPLTKNVFVAYEALEFTHE